jgi:hypothetical protein
MTLYGVLRHIQTYLARIIGTCPTCDTRFPRALLQRRLTIMTEHY